MKASDFTSAPKRHEPTPGGRVTVADSLDRFARDRELLLASHAPKAAPAPVQAAPVASRAATLGLKRAPATVEPAPRPRASSSAARPAAPPVALGPRSSTRSPSPPSRPASEKRSTTLLSSLWAKVAPVPSSTSPPPASTSRRSLDLASSKQAAAAERVLDGSTITPFILDPAALSASAAALAEEDAAARARPESSNIFNSRPVSLPTLPPPGRPQKAEVEPITWHRPPAVHPRDYVSEQRRRAGGSSPFDWLEAEDHSPLEPYLFQRKAGRAATRKPRAKGPPPIVQSPPVAPPPLVPTKQPPPTAIEYAPPAPYFPQCVSSEFRFPIFAEFRR